MQFLVTQSHSPESCPRDAGGSRVLYDSKCEGVQLKARYGAFADHTVYYVVEADSLNAVDKFLVPGSKRCKATITPVSEESISI
ncbi:MAG: DUF3303 family protein [Chloroflexi bacterium]|nr:DUF3303 family protein [Chloroflexota bacterium]